MTRASNPKQRISNRVIRTLPNGRCFVEKVFVDRARSYTIPGVDVRKMKWAKELLAVIEETGLTDPKELSEFMNVPFEAVKLRLMILGREGLL